MTPFGMSVGRRTYNGADMTDDPFAVLFGYHRGALAENPHPPHRLAGDAAAATEIGVEHVQAADVIAAVQACAASLGYPPTCRDYEHWRVRQAVVAAGATAVLAAIPSAYAARLLFRTWNEAQRAAGL